LQLSAIATDSINTVTPEVTWTTNATNGSTISSTGLFTAGSVSQAGTVVTATAAGYGTGTKTIAVTPAFRVVVSSAGNLNSILRNDTLQLSALVTDSLSTITPTITWSTNATNGSAISSNGLFTAGNTAQAGIVVTATASTYGSGTKTIYVNAGKSFYCDPVNGSMSNNGSSATPWSTLQAVFDAKKVFSPSDTIFLRTGFHGSPIIKGLNSENVIIKPESGQSPKLTRLHTTAASNWVISGLTISPVLNNVAGTVLTGGSIVELDKTSNHITVDNCTIYSTNDPTLFTEAQWVSMPVGIHCVAPYSILTNNHIRNISTGADVDGIYTQFSHNLVENISGDGLHCASNYVKIEYNVVRNFYIKNTNHDDMFQGAAPGIDPLTGLPKSGLGRTYGVEIRGNQFISMTLPIEFPAMMQDTAGVKVIPQGIGCFDGFYDGWIVENNLKYKYRFCYRYILNF
jgi:hypothetical protein